MKKLLSLFALLTSISMFGQYEELAQKCTAFVDDHSEKFEKRHLNITNPPIGNIDETDYEFSERFMLRSLEKEMNNLENERYSEYWVNIYGYNDEEDRDWALKEWFGEFIDGQSIRPGRDKRKYDYAQPTIVVINETSIAVLSFECPWYTRENFQNWRDKMLSYFGDANSVVIEVGCEGPLEWTKNPPDPRDRKWR